MRRRMALEPPSNFEHIRVDCCQTLQTMFNARTMKMSDKDSVEKAIKEGNGSCESNHRQLSRRDSRNP